jgi:hypothetical protein
VDLWGRLSNPPEILGSLAPQGFRDTEQRRLSVRKPSARASEPENLIDSEERGRLSNPARRTVRRRLGEPEIEVLVSEYDAGRSLREIAALFAVNHRTVASHLRLVGRPLRVNQRKMSDQQVAEAIRRYKDADAVVSIAMTFGVHPATVRRELRRAGVHGRP